MRARPRRRPDHAAVGKKRRPWTSEATCQCRARNVRRARARQGRQQRAMDMADSYDLIFKGGTVVNQDGEARATSASAAAGSRRIGDLSRRLGRRDRRLPRPACPAGRHRHPGAFPRARPHPQGRPGTGSRSAVMGGVTGVFEMPNTDPLTISAEALADKVEARASPHALRFRLLHRRHARQRRRTCPSSSGCPAAPASRCSWAPRPASCWSRTTRACATFSRPSAAAPRSIPRTSSASRSASICASKAIRARIRSGATRCGVAARSGWFGSRARPASACTCCTSRPRRRWTFSRTTRTSPPSKRRRIISRWRRPIATSGSARLAQMNPPVRDRAHKEGDLARHRTRASSMCSAPTTRRIR